MRKFLPLVLFVLVAIGVVACAPAPAPPAPTTVAPKSTPTPAALASKNTPTSVGTTLNVWRYDWLAVYGKWEKYQYLVWGLFGLYDGPDDPDQPACPKDETAGKPLLCQLDNVRHNGVLDTKTMDELPLCTTGQVTKQATPFPSPPPGIQSANGIFYAMYQCRDAKTSEVVTYGVTIKRMIWGGGQSCPREGVFEGRGPYVLRLCYPIIVVVPTPTPTPLPRLGF